MALAQLPEAEVLERGPDGMPRFVIGKLAALGRPASSDHAVADGELKVVLHAALKPFRLQPSELRLRRVSADATGTRHFRYQQVHRGLEVVGGDLIVHVDDKGTVVAINGTARGDIDPSLTVAITEDEAIAQATRKSQVRGFTAVGNRLVYFQDAAGMVHLVYDVVLESPHVGDITAFRALVDAGGGGVIALHDLVESARFRAVYDAQHNTSNDDLPGVLRRFEGEAAVVDAEVNTLYNKLGDTYDAFSQLFGRDGPDDEGGTIHASVHFGSGVCNAFYKNWWNVLPVYERKILVFGDGSATCAPLGRALDIVAHEYMHWVSDTHAGLSNDGEADGIDEGLSDVLAAVVDAWDAGGKNGQLAPDQSSWLMGEETVPDGFRDMCFPARKGHPDLWTSTLTSHGPHAAAGVLNLAACLLARGGSHPRGLTTNVVTGIGLAKTAQIFYVAQRDWLNSNATYISLRAATEGAAAALGYDLATRLSVSCAWAAVGVGTASNCGKSDILWRATDGQVAVWSMNGTSYSAAYPGAPAGADWQVKGTGDFNGDGKADVLWRNNDGTLALWYMNGGSLLGTEYPTPAGGGWSIVGVGDFNGGGLADILWHASDGQVAIWFMKGSTVAGTAYLAAPGPQWNVAVVGDLNADGISDVVWRESTGQVRTWLMNTNGTIMATTSYTGTGIDWQLKGAGDFDDNGTADLLWRNNDGTVALWFFGTNGTKSGDAYPGSPNPPGLDWQTQGVADFNGNGKSDILWRNNDGTLAIWFDGLSSSAAYPTPPSAGWSIAGTGQFD